MTIERYGKVYINDVKKIKKKWKLGKNLIYICMNVDGLILNNIIPITFYPLYNRDNL